jgi:CubicO group peptidase (beta-lactamase class C family)
MPGMSCESKLPTVLALAAALQMFAPFTGADENAALSGTWESKKIFGPTDDGPVLLLDSGDGMLADFAGHIVPVDRAENFVGFDIPGSGRFEGELETDGTVRGHWQQQPSKFDGNVFATPVRMQRRTDGWQGTVVPQQDSGTFYLLLHPADGLLAADLINPERNIGIFSKLTRLESSGDALSLFGRFRGRGDESLMLRGRFYEDDNVMSFRVPGRGGVYEFTRVDPVAVSGFFARTPGSEFTLMVPPALDDGWKTGTLDEANIDPTLLIEMIRTEILPVAQSSSELSIHAILIARHGKLVLEEYFHGYRRDQPHDSRSASKGVTSVLAAAAMQAGFELAWDTPVYALLDDDALQREPARGAITLRHLVNMNSGLDCDDRNPDSAANEDQLWDNADELDFYQHTLDVDIVGEPGSRAAYCSASANLAGGLIAAAADQSLLLLIDRLLAEPMDIQRYSVPLPPDGHPFMGGGIRWLPRDFLKFPQLILDAGAWNGRQIIDNETATRLVTPEVKIDGGRDYGYLWWTIDYPLDSGVVRAHFMAGNGGQIAMLIPELDLAIVFNAGNYSDRVSFRIQEELIPRYILPAVR